MVVLNAYALRILLHAGEELSGDLGLSFPEMILASERERPLYLQTENLIHLKSKSCIGKKSGLSTSKKQRDNTRLKIDSYIHLKRIGITVLPTPLMTYILFFFTFKNVFYF